MSAILSSVYAQQTLNSGVRRQWLYPHVTVAVIANAESQ